jgi:hypothetical protein
MNREQERACFTIGGTVAASLSVGTGIAAVPAAILTTGWVEAVAHECAPARNELGCSVGGMALYVTGFSTVSLILVSIACGVAARGAFRRARNASHTDRI